MSGSSSTSGGAHARKVSSGNQQKVFFKRAKKGVTQNSGANKRTSLFRMTSDLMVSTFRKMSLGNEGNRRNKVVTAARTSPKSRPAGKAEDVAHVPLRQERRR